VLPELNASFVFARILDRITRRHIPKSWKLHESDWKTHLIMLDDIKKTLCLRNTLLPRLISNQLCLPEANEVVEKPAHETHQ
jgi:hypothetical protein